MEADLPFGTLSRGEFRVKLVWPRSAGCLA